MSIHTVSEYSSSSKALAEALFLMGAPKPKRAKKEVPEQDELREKVPARNSARLTRVGAIGLELEAIDGLLKSIAQRGDTPFSMGCRYGFIDPSGKPRNFRYYKDEQLSPTQVALKKMARLASAESAIFVPPGYEVVHATSGKKNTLRLRFKIPAIRHPSFNGKNLWSDKESTILQEHYNDTPISVLRERFFPKRTERAIRQKASLLGLSKRDRPRAWTMREDTLLKKGLEKMKPSQIQKTLLPGRTYEAVKRRSYELRVGLQHAKAEISDASDSESSSVGLERLSGKKREREKE